MTAGCRSPHPTDPLPASQGRSDLCCRGRGAAGGKLDSVALDAVDPEAAWPQPVAGGVPALAGSLPSMNWGICRVTHAVALFGYLGRVPAPPQVKCKSMPTPTGKPGFDAAVDQADDHDADIDISAITVAELV